MKAFIEIDSDMDFHMITPIGSFTEHMKYTIEADNEIDLRKEIVLFLAKVEIRMPWEQEYCDYQRDKKDDYFKYIIYEAMHKISLLHNDISFSRGGNQTLTIGVC
jgi:hypothetical protein